MFKNLGIKDVKPKELEHTHYVATNKSPGELMNMAGAFKLGKIVKGRFNGFEAKLTKEQAAHLSTIPGVDVVDNMIMHKCDIFTDKAFNITNIKNELGYDGEGVTIAVLDTGVDGNHLDIPAGKIRAFKDFTTDSMAIIGEYGAADMIGGTTSNIVMDQNDNAVLKSTKDTTKTKYLFDDFSTDNDVFYLFDAEWKRFTGDAHSGLYCLRNSPSGVFNRSEIKTTLDFSGQLSFWWKTDRVTFFSNDGLAVEINGVDVFNKAKDDPNIGYSENDWSFLTIPLAAGENNIYIYNRSSDTEDYLMIDDIKITGFYGDDYENVGTRTSAPMQVNGKVEYATAIWSAQTPYETSVKVEVTVDGGAHWYECINGYTIPELDGVTLTNATYQFRYTLRTPYTNVTPVMIGVQTYIQFIPEPFDNEGHGSHVCGIIAGEGIAEPQFKGVAPKAKLVVGKVLDGSGNGALTYLIDSWNWLLEIKDQYGIKVANLSLGFSGDYGDDVLPSIYANEVVEQGIMLFIAAGNEGPDNHTIGTPGSASKVLTIGAVSDPARGGYGIAYFSSRGPTSDDRIKPDICAPGVSIQSISAGSINGYINQSGTSMATPFATGVAALMMQANPNLELDQIKNILIDTAHNEWGFDGPDPEYGHGVINPFGAVQMAKGFSDWRPSQINNQSNRGHLFQPNTKHKYKIDVTPEVKTALITVYRNEKRLGYQPPENYYFRYTSTYNAKFKLAVVTPSGKRIEVMKTPLEYMANTDDTRFAQWEYQPTELGSHIIEVENTKGFLDYMIDVNLHGIKNDPHLLAVDFSKGEFTNISYVSSGVEKWELVVDMGGGNVGTLTATARGPFIKLASGASSGVYVSEAIDLSAIKKVGLSSCSVYGFTINIPGVLKQTGLFEYSLDNKTTWNKIKLQGPIPGLSPYDDLTGKKVYFRITLTTDNANYTPAITNVEYSVKNLIDE